MIMNRKALRLKRAQLVTKGIRVSHIMAERMQEAELEASVRQ